MKANPLSDVVQFLLQVSWTTGVYWLLMLGSIALAVYAFATIESQRSLRHVGDWIFRFLIGSMWWQQTLWKLPPYYTDHPDEPTTTGLYYWMTQMGKSASIPLQADLVNNVVLPHFYLFAPLVYGLEVLTAASLILGIFVRFWGAIGALQILNLWLGLYNAEGEWPWTYFFLLVLQLIFALHRYGRSLGFDAIVVDRYARKNNRGAVSQVVLAALT
jgi:uncharacterized membrane protein YphA (DoxX/SURF4 family)